MAAAGFTAFSILPNPVPKINPGSYENAAHGGCDCPIWNREELMLAIAADLYGEEWGGED